MRARVSTWLIAVAALTASGCGCNGTTIVRPYPPPAVPDVLAQLEAARVARTSFQSESVMDYWVKDQRVKGAVLMMGRPGARLRFNALNPTGGNVAADLACDGAGYQLIDYNNNCQLVGPCDGAAIAQLLRINLEPDDFFALAVGSTPILPGAGGTTKWDSSAGTETLDLRSNGRRQVIVLDGRDQRWDVLESTVYDSEGKVEWKLQNKDFHEVEGPGGAVFRAPGKTKFEQPSHKADLLVRWKEHRFNVELDDAKFVMEIPPGLPGC